MKYEIVRVNGWNHVADWCECGDLEDWSEDLSVEVTLHSLTDNK